MTVTEEEKLEEIKTKIRLLSYILRRLGYFSKRLMPISRIALNVMHKVSMGANLPTLYNGIDVAEAVEDEKYTF